MIIISYYYILSIAVIIAIQLGWHNLVGITWYALPGFARRIDLKKKEKKSDIRKLLFYIVGKINLFEQRNFLIDFRR